jgi:hypothetical protein
MNKILMYVIFFVVICAAVNSDIVFNSDVLIKKSFGDVSPGALSFIKFWFAANLMGFGFLYIAFRIRKAMGAKKIESETSFSFNQKVVDNIKKSDPDFDETFFLKNVAVLAEKMNSAWLQNKMGSVRNLVSAGVYNRFKIQLELMKKTDMQNIMQDWFLSNLHLEAEDKDTDYQAAHIQISAYTRDANVSLSLTPEKKKEVLAETPQSFYSEIWSFVRKKESKTFKNKSLLSGNCPNCGGDISDLGESNQCKYCKTIVNSGDYDWVLAEITQIEEWKSGESDGIDDDLIELNKQNPMVSRQVIEDRASYLFWRWIESRFLGKIEPIQRDATENYIKGYKARKYSLRDVAVGSVDLLTCEANENGFKAVVLVLWSGAKKEYTEPEHEEHRFTLILKKGASKKGGISENSCGSCGAPLPDSDSLKCEYCSADVPSVVNDWLLDSAKKNNE